jgi:hypothetical protein
MWCDVVRGKRVASGVSRVDLAERLGWGYVMTWHAESDCSNLTDAQRSEYIDALDSLAAEGRG